MTDCTSHSSFNIPAELSAPPLSSARENLEGITLVWYDPTIDFDEDSKLTMEQLRALNDFVVFSSIEDDCVAYIKSVEHEKIFFITSGRCAEHILRQVRDLKSIDSVFIFCMRTDKYQHLLSSTEFAKVVGVYSDRASLLESIRENARLAAKQMEVFSFYDQHGEKSTRDLSKEAAGFLWFQMFKDMLMRLPRDHNAKRQMLDFCRHYYHGNRAELQFIDEFERDYTSDHPQAIAWYTKQTFLYRLVNKALRTEDIEQLHNFRFFIADLSANLVREHRQSLDDTRRPTRLYRGLKMEKEEVLLLKQNEGNLISTNGFLSTTQIREVARNFACKPTKRTNVFSVLFEIDCGASELGASIVFADVSQFSAFPDEAEVLFDIGATFRILSVQEGDIGRWYIYMKAVNDGAHVAKDYIALNRQEEEETSPALIFGKLLQDMGQYDQSLRYFRSLLANDPQSVNAAHIYNAIGRTYLHQKDYRKAREYCQQAYDLMLTAAVPRVKDSARPLVNIGLIHEKEQEYGKAVGLYFQALQVFEEYYGEKHLKTTAVLTNIGNCYVERERYHIGLGYFQDVLAIQKMLLPDDHMETAMTLNNMAVVYQKMNDTEQALDYYQRSLAMKRKLLPADHPDIVTTLKNIETLDDSQSRHANPARSARNYPHASIESRSPELHYMAEQYNSSPSPEPFNGGRPEFHIRTCALGSDYDESAEDDCD